MARSSSTNQRPAHTRRIVVYGRPSSGKTCFLAALAMPRLPHPDGYSCIWVNDSQTITKPTGPEEDWDPQVPATALYLGRKWLQKAIDDINAGDVPKANPNDTTPYRLLFDITQPDGRITRIEMIDYSGELVDPNLSEDVLAKQLLAHLEEADGILVLAEAPRVGTEADSMRHATQYRELQILQQAFALVAERRRKGRADPIPVAMLLNKWDRYSRMKFYDAETAAVEVDAFMDQKPPVPQKSLFNVLRAVAGKLDDEPYSARFPVSAFGQTKTITRHTPDGGTKDVEVPRTLIPLQGYGLEDPLIWVCQKADLLEMRQLEADVVGLGTWKVWQAMSRRALGVRSDVVDVKKRVPAHLPEAKKLNGMAWQAMAAFFKQSAFAACFFVALIFLAIQSAVVAHDNHQVAAITPAIEAARTNASPVEWADKWKQAEVFLGGYPKPAWWRLGSHIWVMTPDSARKTLSDLAPQLKEAERILAVRSEFDTVVDRHVQAARETFDLPQAEASRRTLDDLKSPDLDYPLAGKKKAEAIAKIESRIEELRLQVHGTDLQSNYHSKMRRYEFPQAAELLASKANILTTKVNELREDFRNRCVRELTDEVKRQAESENWTRAEKLVADLLGSREAVELISADRRQCESLRDRIRTHQVNRVYNNWRSQPDNAIHQDALVRDGDASGRQAVTSYKSYQNFLNTPQDWTIELDEIYNEDHGATFDLTTATVKCYYSSNYICGHTVDFTRRPESITLSNTGTVSGKRYNDELSLTINYNQTNWNSPTPRNSTWSGKMSALTRGGSTTIILPVGYKDPVVRFHAKLKSGTVPNEPTLPSRRKDDF